MAREREKSRLKVDASLSGGAGLSRGAMAERRPKGPASGAETAHPVTSPPHEPLLASPMPALRAQPPWGPISFLIAVVIPAFACLTYLVFLATPQFVSESRFVIRGSLERLGIDSIGQAAALSALNNSQEAHVVADYIRSPRIVTDLSKNFDLKRLYAGSPLDIIWHLPADASPDGIVRHWRRMAWTDVDATTGIITVRIHAFEPEAAQALNQAVLKLSEALVAGFAQKMRAQRLEEALADSKAAQAEINSLLTALETARGREETLDPLTTATALATLVSSLRDERATLVTAREAAASRLNTDAPSITLTDERIRALDAQIELVLVATTQDKHRATAASDLLSAASLFDFLQIRRELMTRRVARAETVLAQARQDAIRQQVYIDVFMQPTLGETKAFPNPLQTTLLALLGLAAIWAIAALYFETVRERTR